MLKKTLKTLALVTVTWSVAELVTNWRILGNEMSLAKYTKVYFKTSIHGFNELVNDLESTDDFGAEMRAAFFKKY